MSCQGLQLLVQQRKVVRPHVLPRPTDGRTRLKICLRLSRMSDKVRKLEKLRNASLEITSGTKMIVFGFFKHLFRLVWNYFTTDLRKLTSSFRLLGLKSIYSKVDVLCLSFHFVFTKFQQKIFFFRLTSTCWHVQSVRPTRPSFPQGWRYIW